MKKIMTIFPVISGIMWGSAGIFVRTLTNLGMDAYTVVSTRVIVAVIILLLFFGVYDRAYLKIKPKDAWIFVITGLIGMFAINLCYNFAIKELTLSLAAVLLSMSPIFVIIFAAILFREKVTVKKLGCMILALTGCVLVSGIFESGSGMQWSVKGILLGLLAAFFYSIYSLISKLAMQRGYHAYTITFYSLVVVMLVVLPLTDWNITMDIVVDGGIKMILFMILHSLCASVLSYVLFTVSLEYIDAGKASILVACEPIAAMIFGVIFFEEIPTMLSVGGLVLAIIAITIMTLPDKVKSEK